MAQNTTGASQSKRHYRIVGFDHGDTVSLQWSLEQLLDLPDDPTEVHITLLENLDDILDMPMGSTIYVDLARDHEGSIGVIHRYL